MTLTKYLDDFKEVQRLILQIERDLLKQSRLKTMLLTASETVADHRQELRTVKTRMARAGRGKKGGPSARADDRLMPACRFRHSTSVRRGARS